MSRSNQESVKLKKPYASSTFTTTELKELTKCLQDPIYFIETYVYIRHPTKGRVKFKLYDYQKELITNYHKYKDNLAMIPRQMGKSISAAAYILWYAAFNPDVMILIASNKFKGASEIMSRIKFAYEELPNFLRPGIISYNVMGIEFDNGSKISATTTTPDSGRGLSISLLYCLAGETTVNIRNKLTGQIETISLQDLAERLKKSNE